MTVTVPIVADVWLRLPVLDISLLAAVESTTAVDSSEWLSIGDRAGVDADGDDGDDDRAESDRDTVSAMSELVTLSEADGAIDAEGVDVTFSEADNIAVWVGAIPAVATGTDDDGNELLSLSNTVMLAGIELWIDDCTRSIYPVEELNWSLEEGVVVECVNKVTDTVLELCIESDDAGKLPVEGEGTINVIIHLLFRRITRVYTF